MQVDVTSLSNKNVGKLELSDAIYGLPIRPDLLQRAVRWQLAKRQSGNHKTLTVTEIRGTTAKPWNQKGSGKARAGSVRSTQFRGGAVAHGPVIRSHSFKLPKKVRRLALKTALSSKKSDGNLFVIDNVTLDKPSTASLVASFKSLGWGSVLIVQGNDLDKNFSYSIRNIPKADVISVNGINVYDILRKDVLVLTREAAEILEERLK
ncbi:MAG: 50S ribosomal protein L4 [Rhodospirillaceae bacterium]|nr:50S ribosomal protein L4 [Rhodospirillaceae bacterium]|tara:strand:- start:792 stop:1412 length:621 start_codon:yes stop_codon:yes gene_type:complete